MSDEAQREVCVRVAAGEGAAQQVKSFLLSNGIPNRFRGESLRNVHGFTLNGLGEVRIYVPAEFEAQSRELLKRVEAGELELAEDFPVDIQPTDPEPDEA